MATVDEVVRDAITSAASDANYLLAVKWLDSRYKELVSRVKFRHLRKVGELSLPGVVDTGTIAATRGSTTITGTGTSFVTDVGSGTQEYYYFRTKTAWYDIASIGAEDTLTLSSAYAEDTTTSGSYEIVKRFHPVASTARWVTSFVHQRLRNQLSLVPLEELDLTYPSRPIASHWPTHVAQVGVDSNGYPSYEIYPPPEESEIVHYVYHELPTTLTLGSTIPPVVDPYVLKEGILIDIYRYGKLTLIKLGNPNEAAVMANEEAKQRTIWKKAIKDAIRTSRGSDDMTFILQMAHGTRHRSSDQRTARGYVYDNWRQT